MGELATRMHQWLVIVQLVCTLMMGGLCLFVAVVHYPLLSRVGRGEFIAYEREHARRTSWVVAPVMLLEAGSATLVTVLAPAGAAWRGWPGLAALGLLACVWVITFAVNVPQHGRLSLAWDARTHLALVISHWARTLVWLARGVIVAWLSVVG